LGRRQQSYDPVRCGGPGPQQFAGPGSAPSRRSSWLPFHHLSGLNATACPGDFLTGSLSLPTPDPSGAGQGSLELSLPKHTALSRKII
jgi:hypothetical protein